VVDHIPAKVDGELSPEALARVVTGAISSPPQRRILKIPPSTRVCLSIAGRCAIPRVRDVEGAIRDETIQFDGSIWIDVLWDGAFNHFLRRTDNASRFSASDWASGAVETLG
jgi:hypothetical protein